MLLNKLAIAPALIRHRRYNPKPHEFTSTLNYLWFDPDQLVDITKIVHSGRRIIGMY